MRAKATSLFVFIFLFSPALLVGAAEEAPRYQHEDAPEIVRTPLPKPGDPSYSSTANYLRQNYHETRVAAESCLRRHLSRRASPTSDAKKLGMEACTACTREMNAESKASYEFDRLLLQDANRTYDSKLHCDIPQVYASEAIEAKKREADRALQPVREAKFREKAATAAECQKKHSLLFALSTSEPAEDISIAAFNKCRELWFEAVEALVSQSMGAFRQQTIDEHLEHLRKATLEKDIAIVVEARARQRVERAKPTVDGSEIPRANGLGI